LDEYVNSLSSRDLKSKYKVQYNEKAVGRQGAGDNSTFNSLGSQTNYVFLLLLLLLFCFFLFFLPQHTYPDRYRIYRKLFHSMPSSYFWKWKP
jgi:ABC-type multidrug transport system permease subunit